jgi:hypothetical protein
MHDDLAMPEWVLVRVLSVRGREALRNDQSHEAANHCYDLAFGDSLRSAGSPHLSVNPKVGSSSLPPPEPTTCPRTLRLDGFAHAGPRSRPTRAKTQSDNPLVSVAV